MAIGTEEGGAVDCESVALRGKLTVGKNDGMSLDILVGDVVGDTDGLSIAEFVLGESVGITEDISVGSSVGLHVGTTDVEGSALGASDSAVLGNREDRLSLGAVDGICDGGNVRVGVSVGTDEGIWLSVGYMLGMSDDGMLGIADGL